MAIPGHRVDIGGGQRLYLHCVGAERRTNRASLGDMPLIVLARIHGGYDSGMSISPDSLERERRRLMADLAALSTRGRLTFASASGHNIHLEQPELVVTAIRDVVRSSSGQAR